MYADKIVQCSTQHMEVIWRMPMSFPVLRMLTGLHDSELLGFLVVVLVLKYFSKII